MSNRQSSIKKLPQIKQPRERLKLLGASNLSNHELVAILLRTGSSGMSALELAKKINLKADTTLSKLCAVDGIGLAKACTLIACLELGRRIHNEQSLISLNKPSKVFAHSFDIKDKKQEICLAFYLDGSQCLLEKKILSMGALNQNFIEFRQLLAPALNLPAAGIILVHNHPSGNPHPSQQDIEVTQKIFQTLTLLGIDLVDHIIVTSKQYFSLKQANLL